MRYKNKNLISALKSSINGLKILASEKAAIREFYLLLFSIFFIFVIKPNIIYILWLVILPCLILSIEALNSAIEYTCDKITIKKSDKIKKAKDLGSASIFISLFVYVIVIIFCIYEKVRINLI